MNALNFFYQAEVLAFVYHAWVLAMLGAGAAAFVSALDFWRHWKAARDEPARWFAFMFACLSCESLMGTAYLLTFADSSCYGPADVWFGFARRTVFGLGIWVWRYKAFGGGKPPKGVTQAADGPRTPGGG